jgi:hypothetical protein
MALAVEKFNLNEYWRETLFGNPNRYDISGLVRKGAVIYAPLAGQGRKISRAEFRKAVSQF